MTPKQIVNVLAKATPGIEWKQDVSDLLQFSTKAKSLELPGDFMGRLNAQNVFITWLQIKRTGPFAKITVAVKP